MNRFMHTVLLLTFFLTIAAPETSLANPAQSGAVHKKTSMYTPIGESPAIINLLQSTPAPLPDAQLTAEPAADQPLTPAWVEPAQLLSARGLFALSDTDQPAGTTFQPGPSTTTGSPGDWENGWALGCILPLGIAVNAALGASLAASPPFDFFPTMAEYTANLGLKACAPALYPPSDFQVSNVKEAGTCGFTFEQSTTDGEYKNFYSITLPWGDIFPGKSWGDFGEPLVIHWNTNVEVNLDSRGWQQVIDPSSGEPTDEYWLPNGIHELTWTGYTTMNLLDTIPIYIPGGAWTKLSKMKKLEKYVGDVKKFSDNVQKASNYGILGLDLLLDDVMPTWRTGMFNEETQRVAVTDHTPPLLTAYQSGVIAVEAVQPGGVSQDTYLYFLKRTLTVSDDCDAQPDVSPANSSSLPIFAPVGASYVVEWIAKDNGPLDLNGGTNSSALLSQTFIVQDSLAPIILAPPDIVTETANLPALIDLGNPATFDLADLNPSISSNACTRPGVTCDPDGSLHFPAGKTTITWTAIDASGNASTATQLVNIKSIGINHTPTANGLIGENAPQAISYEPITVTLTAADSDLDPLWFKIEQQPGNGFFHAPLYPYFIQDYRLANFQSISFLDYCADPNHRQQYIPTNWPVDANFMAVADDGTVFVHDQGMVYCTGNGGVSTNYRLAVFHPDGTWDQITDSFDTKDIYVDFKNGFIYTVFTEVSNISWFKKLDLQLNLIEQHRLDYADVRINQPRNGVMDNQGLMYVTDGFQYIGGSLLYVYDTTQGPDPVQVANYTPPSTALQDLALDSQNYLYASERDSNRIFKFSPAVREKNGSVTPGQLIGWLGKCDSGPGCDIANGRSFGFSCTDATCALNAGSSGNLPGQFDFPRGITLDPNDILYVTDYNNLRVQRFTPQGYYAGQAVSECDGSCFVLGDFGRPKQVTVNSSHFFILDDDQDLLHVFETTPLTRLDGQSAQIMYQSKNNFVGTDSFTFTAGDGLDTSISAMVEINVSRNYRPPVANLPEPGLTAEDQPVSVYFSGYDPDEPLDTLSFQADTPPAYGTLSGSGLDLLYTPNQDFNGVDTFSIVATDGTLLSNPQPMSVTVTPVNDVPSFPEDSNQPSGIAYRLAGENISLSRFAPLGSAADPMQIGRGFSTLFSVNYYDPDNQDRHLVTVDWGDGSPVEPEGRLLEDGSMTGPVLTEGQTGGSGSVAAEHGFEQPGSYEISVCVTDNVQVDANGNKTPTALSTTGCKSIPVQVAEMTDLILEVVPSYNPLPVDRDLTLHINLTNHPPSTGTGLAATGIILTNNLDARMIFQSVTSSAGTCSLEGRQINCPIGSLAPAETASIEITVSLVAGLQPGDVISNLASYQLDQENQSEVKADLQLLTLVSHADYVVNTIGDGSDADVTDGTCATVDSECSLRAAVEQANAAPGAQTIALADWQILLTSELAVNGDLTITGLGAGKTVLGSAGSNRMLNVASGSQLILSDLTVQGGVTDTDGGGLYISAGASASLEAVQFSGNHAGANGGAIYNGGDLTILDASISGNDSGSGAGGIENSGTLSLQNVTVSGNQGATGGIRSTGSATLVNATVANNHATGSGGGLNGGDGNFALRNTILWGNTAQIAGPNCGYALTSQGYNLLGDLEDCTVVGDTSTNLVGQDARLISLEFNSATTLSHALRSDSPAIDTGACDLPTDQRSAMRPQDGDMDGVAICDIGAYEFAPLRLFMPFVIR